MAQGSLRLFVAVELPPAVVAAVADAVAPLRRAAPELAWVRAEQYHLTLVFLGAVPDPTVPGVRAAVGSACAGVDAFGLALTGRLGTFRRTVLWGELAPSTALADLAGAVRAALREVMALPDGDRPFSAHLTLARARRGARIDGSLLDQPLPALGWDVERVVLLQSHLSPKGARYTVDTACELARAEDR